MQANAANRLHAAIDCRLHRVWRRAAAAWPTPVFIVHPFQTFECYAHVCASFHRLILCCPLQNYPWLMNSTVRRFVTFYIKALEILLLTYLQSQAYLKITPVHSSHGGGWCCQPLAIYHLLQATTDAKWQVLATFAEVIVKCLMGVRRPTISFANSSSYS